MTFRPIARPIIDIAQHPMGALFTHQKGGFYHDRRFATLGDVVDHYDSCMSLGLSGSEKSDLIQYLLRLQFDNTQK